MLSLPVFCFIVVFFFFFSFFADFFFFGLFFLSRSDTQSVRSPLDLRFNLELRETYLFHLFPRALWSMGHLTWGFYFELSIYLLLLHVEKKTHSHAENGSRRRRKNCFPSDSWCLLGHQLTWAVVSRPPITPTAKAEICHIYTGCISWIGKAVFYSFSCGGVVFFTGITSVLFNSGVISFFFLFFSSNCSLSASRGFDCHVKDLGIADLARLTVGRSVKLGKWSKLQGGRFLFVYSRQLYKWWKGQNFELKLSSLILPLFTKTVSPSKLLFY